MYSLEIGCRSHIGARSGRGVSVILVSTESLASQSYRCKMWFKCRNHISINGGASVALISVSIGSFCRTHIRHPPIFVCNIVLMNVFTGLAVGDVANVMNKAEVGFELQTLVFSWKFKCSHRISFTVDR